MVKNPPAKAGDVRDTGLIPGSGKSPGRGNGNPVEYSPGKCHRQRRLVGHSTWGLKDTQLSAHTQTYTHKHDD